MRFGGPLIGICLILALLMVLLSIFMPWLKYALTKEFIEATNLDNLNALTGEVVDIIACGTYYRGLYFLKNSDDCIEKQSIDLIETDQAQDPEVAALATNTIAGLLILFAGAVTLFNIVTGSGAWIMIAISCIASMLLLVIGVVFYVLKGNKVLLAVPDNTAKEAQPEDAAAVYGKSFHVGFFCAILGIIPLVVAMILAIIGPSERHHSRRHRRSSRTRRVRHRY